MIELGGLFGRYRIEAELGRGGMGCVYRAQDTRLQRRVALKVIASEPGVVDAAWEQAKARMLREARAAAAFDHPNAATVFDVGEIDGLPFIAMEYIEGETLRHYVGDVTTPWSGKLALLLDAARALGAAHHAGLVHRDVKPENVMVRADGRVKVLDFGIARRAASVVVDGPTQAEGALPTLTGSGQLVGTPLYMAPEQILGKALDGRVDQFAWAVMAYELLGGAPPWTASDTMALLAAVMTEPVAPLGPHVCGLPEVVAAAIERALSKDPGGRFTSMEELAAVLEPFAPQRVSIGPSGVPEPATPVAPPAAAHAGRRWGVPLVAGLGVVIVALAVLLIPRLRVKAQPSTGSPSPADSPKRAGTTSVTVLDLPLPVASNPDALAAYVAGLHAEHAGTLDVAVRSYEKATSLDATLAIAHLRLSRHDQRPSVARSHFQKAQQLRASLSERDRAMLDALEPAIQFDPPSAPEMERRLAAASARYPADAELAYLLCEARFRLGRMEEAMTAADRALALDDRYAIAWYLKASIEAFAGTREKQRFAVDRCLETSPSMTLCWSGRLDLDALDGRCDDFVQDAKRWAAVDPDSAPPYGALAEAALQTGKPRETAEEFLKQRWQHTQGSVTYSKSGELLDRARLQVAGGNFGVAERLLRDAEATTSTALREHSEPMQQLVGILTERGDLGGAGRVAAAFLKRKDAWTPWMGSMMISLREDPTPFMLATLRRAGTLSDAAAREQRDAWIHHSEGDRPRAYLGHTWIYGYAAAAITREDAMQALSVLPAHEPLPPFQSSVAPDAFVGRTYLLAGQLDQAIAYLGRAAHSCHRLYEALAWVQSHAWLGEAYEKAGDSARACDAYATVLAQWGGLSSSVTVRETKTRVAALHCRR